MVLCCALPPPPPLRPPPPLPQNLVRPDEDEVAKTAKETMEALNRRVTNKLAVQNPSTLPEQPGAPTYIKYTPSQQGAAYASGAKQRIIKMQDMPVSEACLLGWWWMKESTGGRVSLVQKFFCWWLSQGLSWLPL